MAGRRRLLHAAPLVLPVAVGLVLALVLVFRWGGGGDAVRTTENLTVIALSVYATVSAVLAARSADGGGRRAWTVMAVALACWTVGNLIYGLRAILRSHNAFPSPPGYWYIAFALLTAVGMALFPIEPVNGSKVRKVLDAITAALCLLLLMWIAALHGVYDSYTAGHDVSALTVLSPLADLTVLAAVLLTIGRAEPRYRSELWVLTAAIALMAVTDTGYGNLVRSGRFHAGGLLDVGWIAALVAFAVAAQVSIRSPSRGRRPAILSNSPLWLPYVPLLLGGTVGPAMMMSGVEASVVSLIMTSVFFRQSVAAYENQGLLRAAADQALRDPLTGLANRSLFHDRLTHAMTLRQRDDRSVAVVSIDIDDFKLVNDSLGHPVADTVLVSVGQRMLDCVRPGDTVARLGGDEFALLLEGREDQSYLVAGRVVEAFDLPFTIAGEKVLVRPSVGIAVAASGDEPELAPALLMQRADMAMYAAKRSRESGMHSFSADMELAGLDAMELAGRDTGRPAGDGAAHIRLLGELRRAIDQGELDLVYQPKVHLRSGRIVGLEALLRWPHPELGELRPDAFMGLVRQHGLMRRVTELVVARSLDDAARWETAGVDTSIAVNIFAPDLKDAGLPDALCEALQTRGLPTALLTVEITEDLILNDIDRVTTVLRRLREEGIRVAIDDFGSGFSALSYLPDLPIDEVKLDRQFIASITEDKRAAAVVRAVIDLTHELEATVVAEGIEDAGTADWLREHGCDVGQGYYFGAPVAAAMVPQLVGSRSR